MRVNPQRIRPLNNLPVQKGPVIYWMNRDMRSDDNWALLHAQDLALEHKQALIVVFNLVADFMGGGLRQFNFKTEGLKELEKNLNKKNIPLIVTYQDEQAENLLKIFTDSKAGVIVTDFYPLKICEKWITQIKKSLKVAFRQVDVHNIIPCWIASPKREFGAYTIRPKIHRLLPEFLEEFPPLKKHPAELQKTAGKTITHKNDWPKIIKTLTSGKNAPDPRIKPVTWLNPGAASAQKTLRDFLENRLTNYDSDRNDPNKDGSSNLSPHLHYGHISAQRVALETQKYDKHIAAQESFLEELIVRRELSDNFCFYNSDYDNPAGFPDWAKKTINEHRDDPREYLYGQRELETAKTHDDLWNAAQMQMVNEGKMHGYMRMYWAKKILEWTRSPEEAQKIAIHLNDKYELDGRDPNGYTGVAWCLGKHDRAWAERPVFGKVRYMNANGLKRKFDIEAYVEWTKTL